MSNPAEKAWLDKLGIGAGGQPYVIPVEPISIEEDPNFAALRWAEEEAYDLVTNA